MRPGLTATTLALLACAPADNQSGDTAVAAAPNAVVINASDLNFVAPLDAPDGKLHTAHGMAKEFTIQQVSAWSGGAPLY